MEYILKRLGFYLIAFICAVSLNFFMPRMMPGDPVQMYLADLYQSGGKIDPDVVASVEAMFGYNSDEPLIVSYFNYVVGIFTGEWGTSFKYYPQSVVEAVSRGLNWTIFLMGTSLVVGFVVNNVLGILVAWRRGSRLDTTITLGGRILSNIPSVVIALVLNNILGQNGYFPTGYAVTPLYVPANEFDRIMNILYHGFLPCLAILITSFGGIMGMRANMINQLGEDYITMGIAKGVPQWRIMFSYGARNALLPVITSLAMQVGFLLGGSLIIEQVFNYPGLGGVMVNAINGRDYPLMQGILLMSTILMLTANFMADIAIMFLDPRIRHSSK